jgi:hypothetical protein
VLALLDALRSQERTINDPTTVPVALVQFEAEQRVGLDSGSELDPAPGLDSISELDNSMSESDDTPVSSSCSLSKDPMEKCDVSAWILKPRDDEAGPHSGYMSYEAFRLWQVRTPELVADNKSILQNIPRFLGTTNIDGRTYVSLGDHLVSG